MGSMLDEYFVLSLIKIYYRLYNRFNVHFKYFRSCHIFPFFATAKLWISLDFTCNLILIGMSSSLKHSCNEYNRYSTQIYSVPDINLILGYNKLYVRNNINFFNRSFVLMRLRICIGVMWRMIIDTTRSCNLFFLN